MNTYQFEHAQLVKELILLNSVLLASTQNSQLVSEQKSKIISINVTEREIIQEYLISSAIKLRIIDDKFKSQRTNLPVLLHINVGVFLGEKNEIIPDDLSLREACNKIVHALKFEIDTPPGNAHLLPIVLLEGIKDKKPWKVQIDVIKYVVNGLAFIKIYEEEPYL